MESLSEVVVTLTPLDDSLARTLTLNPTKKHIEIGRASKTASKGLVASKDNAWFDSPIMSRTHAELHLVMSPERTLYLQDRGSTHGTFIENRRLNAGEKYPFENGDVVTFGQKIISGLSTYPAKSFHVSYFWQSWRNSIPVPNPESWSKNVNPGFRAPSEDSESEEDRSREVSFERIGPVSEANTPSTSPMSNVPTIIDQLIPQSIPPSCADLETPSQSVIVGEPPHVANEVRESRDSPVQIPSKTSQIEILDLTQNDDEPSKTGLKADSLGSSQANPIDLEPTELKAQYDTVSDSDDEGPEVLPISHESLGLPLAPATVASHDASDEFTHIFGYHTSHTKNESNESKKEKTITAESTIADSDMGDSDLDDPFFASEDDAYFETEDELDHMRTVQRRSKVRPQEDNATDDDEDDESVQSSDHRELAQIQIHVNLDADKDKLDQGTQAQCNTDGSTPAQRANVLVKDSQTDVPLGPSTSFTSEVLDISHNSLNCPVWPAAVHRAPSPSDAALAKPPTAALARLSRDDLVSRVRFEEEDRYKTAPAWVHYKEDVACSLNTNNSADASHGRMEEAPNTSYASFNPCPPDFLFNYADHTSFSRYDDGPFTTWPRYNMSPAPQPHFSMASRHYNEGGQQNDLRTNCGPYGQPYWRHNNESQKESVNQDLSYIPTLEASVLKAQDLQTKSYELGENSEKRDTKLSRLPISDIVNDASGSISDSPRSLKRKADAIASEPLSAHLDDFRPHEAFRTCIMDPFPVCSGALVDRDGNSEEFGLSDAQPREEQEVQEAFSNESLFQPSSQSDRPVALDVIEGPAKKRVKTDKRSRMPVQTFLSGMLAGGLSVFGALLVYGATAPESLHDTVRHEFQ